MIEKGLITKLIADAAVSALVGARITPLKAGQNVAFPRITLFRVDSPRIRSLSGPSGLAHPRIQIDCWGTTYLDVKKVSDKVRLALDGFRGTAGTYTVQGCHLMDERDDYETPEHADEIGVFRTSLDFEVWYEEATV